MYVIVWDFPIVENPLNIWSELDVIFLIFVIYSWEKLLEWICSSHDRHAMNMFLPLHPLFYNSRTLKGLNPNIMCLSPVARRSFDVSLKQQNKIQQKEKQNGYLFLFSSLPIKSTWAAHPVDSDNRHVRFSRKKK